MFGRWAGQQAAVYSDAHTIVGFHAFEVHPVIRQKIRDAMMAHPFDMAAAEDYFFEHLE